MGRIRVVVVCILLLALVCPAAVAVEQETGMIRVRLASMGTVSAVEFEVTAPAAIEGNDAALSPGVRYTLGIPTEGDGLTLGWTDGAGAQTIPLPTGIAIKAPEGWRVNNPTYGWVEYEGELTAARGQGSITLTATLPLEDYLCGVVASEMNDRWPLEALKAQAVCARTYALRYCKANAGKSYDIGDTTSWQVYRGVPRNGDGTPQRNVQAAVEATAGLALYYGNALADGLYSASNGGFIRLSSEVWGGGDTYQVAKEDLWDSRNPMSPSFTFLFPMDGETGSTASLNADEQAIAQRSLALVRDAVAAQKGVGADAVRIRAILAVQPARLSAQRSAGSREYTRVAVAVRAEVGGSPMDLQVELVYTEDDGKTAGELRTAFAEFSKLLPTMNLWQMTAGQRLGCWTITVRGYGHGVGMSQRGAQQMAQEGKDYLSILQFYFNFGAEGSKPVELRAAPESSSTAAPSATASVTPAATSTVLPTEPAYSVNPTATVPTATVPTATGTRPPAVEGLWGLLDSPCPMKLHAAPETGSEELSLVPRNASVEVLAVDEKAHWLEVRFDGTEGYLLARYVRTVGGRPCTLTAGPVALRAGVVASGRTLAILQPGQVVRAGTVVRVGTTLWRRVQAGQLQGYVPERFCRLAWH